MQAIIKLKKAGFTNKDMAQACGTQDFAVRAWLRGDRSPNSKNRASLLILAESRGLTLLGSDFTPTPKRRL